MDKNKQDFHLQILKNTNLRGVACNHYSEHQFSSTFFSCIFCVFVVSIYFSSILFYFLFKKLITLELHIFFVRTAQIIFRTARFVLNCTLEIPYWPSANTALSKEY